MDEFASMYDGELKKSIAVEFKACFYFQYKPLYGELRVIPLGYMYRPTTPLQFWTTVSRAICIGSGEDSHR
eukprot:2004669-Rhodomonas_salina.1